MADGRRRARRERREPPAKREGPQAKGAEGAKGAARGAAGWLRRPLALARAPMGRRERVGLALVALLIGVLLLLTWGSRLGDEPLRRQLEARMNQQLHGYTVRIGHAHGGPLHLSLTLRDLVVRQQANPEPPLATIPRLRLSVEWHHLFTRHLVGDALFDHPQLHLDIEQLHIEKMKQLRLGERGWQAALESIYPLKFNTMRVNDGSLVYVDGDPSRPLEITHWMLSATNIRNLEAPDHVYPSPVQTEGDVFGTGHAAIEGSANFLGDPFPGVHARYRIERVPLDRLQQFGARSNFELHGGVLSSHGEVEYAPRVKQIDVAELLLGGVRLDYVHTAATAAAERRRGEALAAAAKEAEASPVVMRLDRLYLTGGQVGYVNRATDPPYRLFVDQANLEVLNMSNRIASLRAQGAVLRLRGRFMGGGSAAVTATFRPGAPAADLGAEVAIEAARLTAFNDLLRAYRKLDVAAGTASLYSQVAVKDRQLSGYVKAIFSGVKVYDARQDRGKPLGTKLKEKAIGGLAALLANQKNGQLATRTEITGTLGAPRANTAEILGGLIGNAFRKAIVPGFDNAARGGPGKQEKR
ncbi:MAG TPA: DUF748 domain-containing protein [Thermoanaerobaculia bacterium]|nr:DUF748 domain-containing protein [Thermoanaerobaculia bacterium]